MLTATLSTLLGQPEVSAFLRGIVGRGRYANAYLFHGPHGVGKCTAALAFARAVLCERVPGLGLTLDPSHYIAGPHQGKNYDQVFPYVRHVQLRDTGRGPNQFQVRVGQGEV